MCLVCSSSECQSEVKPHDQNVATFDCAPQLDEGMWATVPAQGSPWPEHELKSAEQVATFPMRTGGLGMRSASRCALAACWGSSWPGGTTLWLRGELLFEARQRTVPP